MKILVIGGSYFFGRWFVQTTYKEHEITVLNRGTIKVSLPGVREIICDRHDLKKLDALALNREKYDIVIDFCAYDKGDISSVIGFLDKKILKKYIYISTVDVYAGSHNGVINEESPFKDHFGDGPEGAYMAGKVALEYELVSECEKYNVLPISIRPAILYGPLNYAPRESVYFDWIEKAGQILHPVDADGYWQMIYVEDAAKALKKLCDLQDGILKAYNFCTADRITYDSFEEALKECGCDFEKVDISVSDVVAKNIPLPFPLSRKESDIYSSSAFEKLLNEQTGLAEGLKRCIALR